MLPILKIDFILLSIDHGTFARKPVGVPTGPFPVVQVLGEPMFEGVHVNVQERILPLSFILNR
jgi:hypothetical protein